MDPEIRTRFQKLEKKVFEFTYEEHYVKESARKQSKAISDGKQEHHIGDKSKEVLQQELTSHEQNFRETMTNDEKSAWTKTKDSIKSQIRRLKNN